MHLSNWIYWNTRNVLCRCPEPRLCRAAVPIHLFHFPLPASSPHIPSSGLLDCLDIRGSGLFSAPKDTLSTSNYLSYGGNVRQSEFLKEIRDFHDVGGYASCVPWQFMTWFSILSMRFFYLTGFAAQKACSRRTNDIITFTSYTRRFFLERLLTNQRFFLFYPEPPH